MCVDRITIVAAKCNLANMVFDKVWGKIALNKFQVQLGVHQSVGHFLATASRTPQSAFA
jgi:hypothetical protein